jgi:hypothetical protein
MALIGFPVRWPSGRPVWGSFRHPSRTHRVCSLVDVDEFGRRAGLANGLHCRNERVSDRHHGVALAHARRHQRESHRVRAVGDADAVLRATVVRKLPLEAFDLRPADECRGPECFPKRGHELFLEFAMRRNQIKKRNRLLSHHVPCW